MVVKPPISPLFPYTTLFRSLSAAAAMPRRRSPSVTSTATAVRTWPSPSPAVRHARSEEHTSELQSRENLVCRLLLDKKKHQSTQTKFDFQALSYSRFYGFPV